jgi:DNA-binding MarR family transcriptional regulator
MLYTYINKISKSMQTYPNKTVELVVEWANFEEKHKGASIEDFCRYYLLAQREKQNTGENFSGVVPSHQGAYLAKLLGRICQIMNIYIGITLKGVDKLNNLQDFYFLNSIHHLGECRKTTIIDYNFAELSSGIDVINRLLKLKYIEERVDPDDKRGRLIKATAESEHILKKCYQAMIKVSDIVFWEVGNDEKKLCIQLLKGVEIKHSKLVHKMKLKSIEEIHEIITGVRDLKQQI